MTPTLDPAAAARARSLGAAGTSWLESLPDAVDGLARDWGLQVLRSLVGGTTSWVGLVRRDDGSRAVLKVTLPLPGLDHQVETLVRADGRGHVRVLRHDLDRYAVLLEELGDLPDPEVVGHVALMRRTARVLRLAWEVDRDPQHPYAPGADPKVVLLRGLLDEDLARIAEPVPPRTEAVVDRARALLDRRAEAWDAGRAVVVHGDAHIANLLPVRRARPGAVDGHVLVDPEAFLADPAYDLGVVVRDWNGVLASSADPAAEVRSWCRMLAEETGLDKQAVWEWGFIERVTSGLRHLGIGLPDRGRPFLEVAARLG